jgi:hypothetical protein
MMDRYVAHGTPRKLPFATRSSGSKPALQSIRQQAARAQSFASREPVPESRQLPTRRHAIALAAILGFRLFSV